MFKIYSVSSRNSCNVSEERVDTFRKKEKLPETFQKLNSDDISQAGCELRTKQNDTKYDNVAKVSNGFIISFSDICVGKSQDLDFKSIISLYPYL